MCRCDIALELISRQLDEALTNDEYALLAAHLAACDTCATLALSLKELHEAMAGMSAQVPVPPGFADTVMAKIRLERALEPAALPIKRGWKKNWRVWGGLAAVLVLVAVSASRLPLLGMMGASGDSTAAAPSAVGEGSADAGANDEAEPKYSYRSAEDTVTDTDTVTATDTDESLSHSIITGSLQQSAPTTSLDGSPDAFMGIATGSGGVVTAEKAGYLLLETIAVETIDQYESVTEDESLTLIATTRSGVTYTLIYNGISEDGKHYEYTQRGEDGAEQIWSVTVDGSEITQN